MRCWAWDGGRNVVLPDGGRTRRSSTRSYFMLAKQFVLEFENSWSDTFSDNVKGDGLFIGFGLSSKTMKRGSQGSISCDFFPEIMRNDSIAEETDNDKLLIELLSLLA